LWVGSRCCPIGKLKNVFEVKVDSSQSEEGGVVDSDLSGEVCGGRGVTEVTDSASVATGEVGHDWLLSGN
jgi:hypothetical protein